MYLLVGVLIVGSSSSQYPQQSWWTVVHCVVYEVLHGSQEKRNRTKRGKQNDKKTWCTINVSPLISSCRLQLYMYIHINKPPITSIAFTNGNCTNVVKASIHVHVHLHHSYLSTIRCKTSNITDTLFVVILENKTVDYCE